MAIYKTASGKTIDMGQLALKNEKVRAVGNMSVNARGDVIDPNSNPTSSRATQVNKSYRKQTRNIPKDVPVAPKKTPAPAEEIVGLDEPVVEDVKEEKPKAKAKGGLAGAIAKTKKK